MDNKPRSPWLAGLLTLITIGLGHIYCGEIKRGVILFAGAQVTLVLSFTACLFFVPVGVLIALIAVMAYLIYCIVDAVRLAKAYKLVYLAKPCNRWYVYLLYWFVASVVIHTMVAAAVKHHIVQAYKIPSSSMVQALEIGDHIITDKFIYKIKKPKRGDIIVFQHPKDPQVDYIKRIVGMGGETLEIRDKQVFINGEPYAEPYKTNRDSSLMPKGVAPRDNFGPVVIPEDSLFVMGDNRDFSNDSRFWGFVARSSVKGKAKGIYWSWDRDNFKVRWHRIGMTIK